MRPSASDVSITVALVVLSTLVAPLGARADDDHEDDAVRVSRSCSTRSTVALRLREADDDELWVDLTVRTRSRHASWNVVLVRERRLVWRTRARTGPSGSFSRRVTVAEWPGRNTIVVRAVGPRGEICRATATLHDD